MPALELPNYDDIPDNETRRRLSWMLLKANYENEIEVNGRLTSLEEDVRLFKQFCRYAKWGVGIIFPVLTGLGAAVIGVSM